MYPVQIHGRGLMDFLNNPLKAIKGAFQPVATELNNESSRTIYEYGNYNITSITIAREKLNGILSGAINALSLGKFNELKQKYGYDSLYHLFLIVGLDNGIDILIEKNEVIVIKPFNKGLNDSAETFPININKRITLNEFINKTFEMIGPDRFYHYDPLRNNCQVFVQDLLTANGLYSNNARNFVLQDFSNIEQELKESNYGYVPDIMQRITDFASRISRLRADGKKKGGATKEILGWMDIVKMVGNEKKNKNMLYKDILIKSRPVYREYLKKHGLEPKNKYNITKRKYNN